MSELVINYTQIFKTRKLEVRDSGSAAKIGIKTINL
jgi:hypothetical protein